MGYAAWHSSFTPPGSRVRSPLTVPGRHKGLRPCGGMYPLTQVGFWKRARPSVGAREVSIDSNKIKKAHQLPSFLRLGPGPWRAFALGVAHGVAWLPRLRWRWRDPGGVHKRHLHLDARTGPNEAHLAPHPSQERQGSATTLQQPRHDFHQQVDGDLERVHALLRGQLHLQAMKHLG